LAIENDENAATLHARFGEPAAVQSASGLGGCFEKIEKTQQAAEIPPST
jgi:hypothetical protein